MSASPWWLVTVTTPRWRPQPDPGNRSPSFPLGHASSPQFGEMADMDELFGSDGDSDNEQRGNFQPGFSRVASADVKLWLFWSRFVFTWRLEIHLRYAVSARCYIHRLDISISGCLLDFTFVRSYYTCGYCIF